MAAITAVTPTYDSGSSTGERVCLYLLKNVDTADTYVCSAQFGEVKAAAFVPSGVLTSVGTVSASGTTLTLTLATMTDDNLYLLVIGNSV